MSEQSSFQVQQPAYVEKSSNKKRLLIIFLVVLLLLIAGLGALYLLGSSSAKHSFIPTNPIPTAPAVSPTSSSSTSAQLTATPSAALSPTPNLKSLTVSVLNGSGTAGAAGKIASALTSAGFTNITTGNAKAYTYTGIIVYVKDKANLAPVQSVITTASPSTKITASVDNTIPTDVEVIVGK